MVTLQVPVDAAVQVAPVRRAPAKGVQVANVVLVKVVQVANVVPVKVVQVARVVLAAALRLNR